MKSFKLFLSESRGIKRRLLELQQQVIDSEAFNDDIELQVGDAILTVSSKAGITWTLELAPNSIECSASLYGREYEMFIKPYSNMGYRLGFFRKHVLYVERGDLVKCLHALGTVIDERYLLQHF